MNIKVQLREDKEYRKAFLIAVIVPVVILTGAIIVACSGDFFLHVFPTCTMKLFTGWNCISCGATRATLALAHGHLLTAIYYNPLYVLFLGWLCYLYARLIISLIRRPYRKYSLKVNIPQGILVGVAIIGFFIIRNTEFYQSIFY